MSEYGFTTALQSYIVAKDTKHNKVLLGGLGCLGVGRMWFDLDDRQRAKPDYADAPDIDYETYNPFTDLLGI